MPSVLRKKKKVNGYMVLNLSICEMSKNGIPSVWLHRSMFIAIIFFKCYKVKIFWFMQ